MFSHFPIVRFLVITGVSIIAVAPTIADEINLEGDYVCTGSNPDGGMYKGSVKITKNADAYSVKWTYVTTTYEGTALLEDKSLSVCWLQKVGDKVSIGIAVYKLQKDGSWDGKWTPFGGDGKVRRETLTPVGDDF